MDPCMLTDYYRALNSVISDVSFDTKKQLVAATFLDDGDTNASARCLGAVDAFCPD